MKTLVAILFCLVFIKPIILVLSVLPLRIAYTIRKRQHEKNISGNSFMRVARSGYLNIMSIFDVLISRIVAFFPSHHIRNFFYRHVYRIEMGRDVVFYIGTEIRNPTGLSIGKGTVIGDNAILDARAGLLLGDNVVLASNVSIWTYQHDYRDPEFRCSPEHYGPVSVGNRVWIGPNVVILHDVTIGEGAVIAAGSVVTKDIPPFTLVGGIPAKKIGNRPDNLTYELDGKCRHFY